MVEGDCSPGVEDWSLSITHTLEDMWWCEVMEEELPQFGAREGWETGFFDGSEAAEQLFLGSPWVHLALRSEYRLLVAVVRSIL